MVLRPSCVAPEAPPTISTDDRFLPGVTPLVFDEILLHDESPPAARQEADVIFLLRVRPQFMDFQMLTTGEGSLAGCVLALEGHLTSVLAPLMVLSSVHRLESYPAVGALEGSLPRVCSNVLVEVPFACENFTPIVAEWEIADEGAVEFVVVTFNVFGQ